MIATRIAIAAVVLACATAAAAQTHAELLEKAIFTDETAGDLPGAIRLYERLVSTPGVSRDIASRAQARLAEGKRRRDQSVVSLTALHTSSEVSAAGPSASARQTGEPVSPVVRSREWNFGAPGQQVDGCCGMFSEFYDPARTVTVMGKVVQVMWVNPLMVIVVEGSDGNRWGFTAAAPNAMIRSGLNKDSFKLGEDLRMGGFIAKGQTDNCPAALPNGCATLQNGALHASASIITASDGKVLFDRSTFNTAAPAPAK